LAQGATLSLVANRAGHKPPCRTSLRMAAPQPPLRPGVGFCLQTESTGSPGRWYINMTKHKLVEMPVAPSGKPVSRDWVLTHGLGNLQVPFDVGSFRKLKARSDGAKQTTYCIDVVFNPFIIQLFMDDDFCNLVEQYRSWVMNLALKRIEESIGVKLSAQKVALVKKLRYKDGEDGDEDTPKEFTELPGEKDSFDAEFSREPEKPPAEAANEGPLIQDLTPGARKPAIKKGFFNKSSGGELYPNGSNEGVVPENAGDPMGWMPKKLRNTCKIVDCNSPEYQEQERKRKETEEANASNAEFRNSLTKDMDKWVKAQEKDKWEADLPDGAGPPPCKYDNDYARFDRIDDIDDKPAAEERDWYYDSKGQRCQMKSKTAAAQTVPAEMPESEASPLRKGFLDSAKKPLYPKGSEQGKVKEPPSEEELMKELAAMTGEGAGMPKAPSGEAPRPGLSVKKQECKTADFTLSEVSEALQLVVSVPGLESMKEVSLDVTEKRASLGFPGSAGLKPLQVELPTVVVPKAVKAKFSKKTHQITITLPLAAN